MFTQFWTFISVYSLLVHFVPLVAANRRFLKKNVLLARKSFLWKGFDFLRDPDSNSDLKSPLEGIKNAIHIKPTNF